ncbi:hypothetical protein PHMEG_0008343 [Phytophthora megakarya]|uniref:Uncharacterized protein n=1 Tax=Phytophthora megakarya TaxID=4795 RepID=A0A225WJ90_9STRA|nr:hypothetical protein PHMEG_0008343 [Phytophthora megakarya]
MKVGQDIEAIYRKAANMHKPPYELTYPWTESKVWYDPEEYPDLHVAHWRLWMTYRRHFFDWQLNAPLKVNSQRGARRRWKQTACAERLHFLSLCIETWGYYDFLRRFERVDGDRLLMWFGGHPGKNSPDARKYDGPTILNLTSLYAQDEAEYKARVAGALKPFQLDQGGFRNLTELLVYTVYTGALDPDEKPNGRLADETLAMVRLDIEKKVEPWHEWWMGDTKIGVWSKLMNNPRIKQLAEDLAKRIEQRLYKPHLVPPVTSSEMKKTGWTPMQRPDGTYTAEIAAVLEGEGSEASDIESSNEEEEEEKEEEDQLEEKPESPLQE